MITELKKEKMKTPKKCVNEGESKEKEEKSLQDEIDKVWEDLREFATFTVMNGVLRMNIMIEA